MSDDILDVCKELDGLMIRVLELMEEQIKCKLKLQDIMKTSCLELAKTRYIMGNHCVSYLQLPTEESAEVTAQRTVASSLETKNNVEHLVFELCTVNPEGTSLGKQEDNNLRKRAGKEEDERKEEADLIYKKGEENLIVTATDPIKWFGYLVPQNLRRAQKGFHTALELVVQNATIQSELNATCNRCDKLLKLKTAVAATES
jgi:hypothetical protein